MPSWVQWLGVFLAGLALGFAIAWLARPDAAAAPMLNHAASAAPESDAVDESPPPVLDRPQPQSEAAPAAVDTRPAPPETSVQPGDGVVTGVVTWTDGTPCVDLPLVLERSERGRPSWTEIDRATHDERLAHYERALRWGDAFNLEAITGADGRFQVAGLHDDSYRVVSGDQMRPLSRRWINCKAGDELSLTVRRAVTVQFEFVLEGGGHPGEVKLQVKSQYDSMGWLQPWVPGRAYLVDPGPCSVKATGGPHHLWKGQVEFDAPPQGFAAPVRVVLQSDHALVVHRDQPDPYYWVSTQVIPTRQPGAVLTPEDVRAGLNSWMYQMENPSIHPNLTPGRYTVLCMLGMSAILHQTEVVLEGGIQDVHVTLPPPRREDHMVVRVMDPDGKSLAKAQVEIDGPGFFRVHAAIEREPGLHWLRCIEPQVEGEYTVTVTSQFGKRIERVPTAFRGELAVQFGGVARLVLYADNIPADATGLVLGVVPRGDELRNAFQPQPGQRAVTGLVPVRQFTLASGPVVVVLGAHVRGDFGVRVVYQREVNLRPGDNEERVDLSRFASLRVRVPEGTNALTVRGTARTETRDAADGVVDFMWLEAGTWWLESPQGCMRLTTPAGGVIEFRPLPFNALMLEALDTGGTLAAAGMQVGDLIRHVNGVDLTGSRAELSDAIARAAAAGSLTLSFERAGRWQTVVISAEAWKALQGHRVSARRIGD